MKQISLHIRVASIIVITIAVTVIVIAWATGAYVSIVGPYAIWWAVGLALEWRERHHLPARPGLRRPSGADVDGAVFFRQARFPPVLRIAR